MGTVDLQLEYTWEELLSDPPVVEPLRVDGVGEGGLLCHGGFLEDGSYAPPRTGRRPAAIRAWQESHARLFGTEILHAPLESWPGNYPNLEQARFLLRQGVREPIVASLTRIGTVEGFGAMIRHLAPEDMQPYFADDIAGTATAHLGRGLVEAHARDEAGWEDRAGHNRMWFAVRDVAFENPVTADQTELMMARMGIGGTGGGSGGRPARARLLEDVDPELEALIGTMCRVLFIEIKAFHVFAWAETLLSDAELVAGDGEAARIVSYIRADETPHIEYLRTALTEMRDRTFRGLSGRRHPGTEIIGRVWDASLAESMGPAEEQNRTAMAAEVALALEGRPGGDDLLEQFHSLGEWRPAAAVS